VSRFDPAGTYLAMDTSLSLGSVVVWRGGEVLARAFLARQGEHASRLVPAMGECLRDADLTVKDLDGLVVGQGPGSFTGVRVAAATAKGMVASLGCPLWAFSSLEAGAASAGASVPMEFLDRFDAPATGSDSGWHRPVCILFDARGDRVYAGAYRFSDLDWEVLLEPTPSTIGEILEHPSLPPDTAFAGDGALRHSPIFRDAGLPVLAAPAGLPTAEGLMRLLALRPETPPLEDPGRWEPTYLRGTSARPMVSP